MSADQSGEQTRELSEQRVAYEIALRVGDVRRILANVSKRPGQTPNAAEHDRLSRLRTEITKLRRGESV